MSTDPAQPLIAEEGATLRRDGRALIGWMTSEQGAIALAGGQRPGAQDAGLLDRVEAARAAVASREAGADQEGILNDHHPALPDIVRRLQAQTNTEAFWTEGWSVAVVNLARVCSLQQAVASERARERVRGIDPDDLSAIAGVTLPQASTTQLPAQFDEVRKAWIISAANPNLRITGQFGGELQPGTIGFGFTRDSSRLTST
jgi:hypothetical protein